MATGRFHSPKTEKEEIALLFETVPKNTKYNTKWTVHVFTAWQTRMNRKAQLETGGGNGLESTNLKPVKPVKFFLSFSVFNNCIINFVVKKWIVA